MKELQREILIHIAGASEDSLRPKLTPKQTTAVMDKIKADCNFHNNLCLPIFDMQSEVCEYVKNSCQTLNDAKAMYTYLQTL